MVVHAASLLFSATLKDAAGLRAVLDLVDKDFSQDAGKHRKQGYNATAAAAAGRLASISPTTVKHAPEQCSPRLPQIVCSLQSQWS